MKDGIPRQLRIGVAAAVVLALLATPAFARAQIRWLVPAAQDVEPWAAAVAGTWADGTLLVEVWTGAWPPDAAQVGGAHAFVEDLGTHTLVRLRDGGGGEVALPVEGDHRASAHARTSILLVLRGLASPLGIADHGWRPPPRPVPTEQVPLEAARGGVEAPLTASPFDIGLAAGLSGRPGLDAPALALCVAPRWRLSPGRGPTVHLAVDVVADLSGRVDVGDVPVRLDTVLIAAGAEVRPLRQRIELGLDLGVGARIYGARRLDREAAGVLVESRPALRLAAKVSGPLGRGVRVGARVAWSADMIAEAPALRLQLGPHDAQQASDVGIWSLTAGMFVQLGSLDTSRVR